MMEFVNGKDDIPFKVWKTKIHVSNHQADNKHRNMLAENDFYTIPHKRVALCGLRNMLAEYMALKMEKKNVFFAKNCHFDQWIWRFSSTWETVLSTRITWQRQPAGVFFGKSHGFGIMLTVCAFISHTGLLKYSIWLQVRLSWTHEPISGESHVIFGGFRRVLTYTVAAKKNVPRK
jgi:hypothetical protein